MTSVVWFFSYLKESLILVFDILKLIYFLFFLRFGFEFWFFEFLNPLVLVLVLPQH
jgi:hypothetical protein